MSKGVTAMNGYRKWLQVIALLVLLAAATLLVMAGGCERNT